MSYHVSIQYFGANTEAMPFMGGLYQFGRSDTFPVAVQLAAQMLGYEGATPDNAADPKRNKRLFLLTDRADFDKMLADGHLSPGADPEMWCTVGALASPQGGGPAAADTGIDPDAIPVVDAAVNEESKPAGRKSRK